MLVIWFHILFYLLISFALSCFTIRQTEVCVYFQFKKLIIDVVILFFSQCLHFRNVFSLYGLLLPTLHLLRIGSLDILPPYPYLDPFSLPLPPGVCFTNDSISSLFWIINCFINFPMLGILASIWAFICSMIWNAVATISSCWSVTFSTLTYSVCLVSRFKWFLQSDYSLLNCSFAFIHVWSCSGWACQFTKACSKYPLSLNLYRAWCNSSVLLGTVVSQFFFFMLFWSGWSIPQCVMLCPTLHCGPS